MAATVPVHRIGGQGGGDFHMSGAHKGAILKRIRVCVGGWLVRGVEVQLSDGETRMFGTVDGGAHEFTFQIGENVTSLSLWGNGEGSRLGAIKFRTTHGRQFIAKMTDWPLKTEYGINVGCGICVGVQGKCGADIDCMGFIFLRVRHSPLIGGKGGGDFHMSGAGRGAILKRIRVWVGGWLVRGVEVQLSNGETRMFGQVDGGALEFTFQKGEKVAWLSLWGNGAGSRLGAIKFGTTHGRDFFAKMTDEGLRTEHKIDVGSGICVGVHGKCGADIDSMGFIFK